MNTTTEDSLRRVLTYPALLDIAEVGVAAYGFAAQKYPGILQRLLRSIGTTTTEGVPADELIAMSVRKSRLMAHYSPEDARTAVLICLYTNRAEFEFPQDFLETLGVPDIAELLAPLVSPENEARDAIALRIADTLRNARNNGISLSALADELGTSVATLSNYAAGRNFPPKRRREGFYARATAAIEKLTLKLQSEKEDDN